MRTRLERSRGFSGTVGDAWDRATRGWLPALAVPLLVLVLCPAAPAAVKEPPTVEEATGPSLPRVSGSFLTYFFWKNDRDFDRTEAVFDRYGQSVGYVDVSVFPRLSWELNRNVRFFYYAEIGNAFWSRTNPDPFSRLAEEKPVYLQKQLGVEILLPWQGTGVRAGFQYIHDPTFLFLEKDAGALNAFYRQGANEIRLTALQVPDTAYEGIDFDKNNFQNDDFVFALDGTFEAAERTFLRPGLFVEVDQEDVDRPRLLFTPCLNLSHDFGGLGKWMIDLAFQTGRWEGRSIANQDLDLLAGAAQLHGTLTLGKLELAANLFGFTPDDNDPYNGVDTSFAYSGLSRSRTLVLTQNWLFDQYDNLDERVAASKAGYLQADLYSRYPLGQGFEVFNVVGYGMVLQDRFANRGRTVGTEVDLGVFWFPAAKTRLTALGGVLVPGHAGAAFQNEISLGATEPVYYFQGAIEVFF